MIIVKVTSAIIFSGCFGVSAVRFFQGEIGIGLGLFVIGVFFAVFFISSWIVDSE